MKIRWTTPARRDLAGIVRYIRSDNPTAAQRVGTRIRERVAALSNFEHGYRRGEVEGTREIVVTPWPYIVVYRVLPEEVQILRVRHASQDWP